MKQNLVEEIRNSIDNYDHIYIFSAHHIRTNKLKDMRLEWGQSRFVLSIISLFIMIKEKRQKITCGSLFFFFRGDVLLLRSFRFMSIEEMFGLLKVR